MSVVVDTSVWIDFFIGRPALTLEAALAAGSVILPPVVLAELVSGARRPSERASIIALTQDLKLHETPRVHWRRVGELRSLARRSGLALSTPDAHVAQCALDLEGLLVSRDRVFAALAAIVPLRTTER